MGHGSEELLAALRRGEEDAFRSVAELAIDDLYVVARGILGDAEGADDACQEALVRLYRAAPKLSPDTTLRAWLRKVCVNYCLDERRRRKRHEAALRAAESAGTASPLGHPQKAAEETEFRRAVGRALGQLPPRQRAIFVLRHFRDCSVRETGEILGCADGTVKAGLSRAVRTLRDLLRDWDSRHGEV